MAKSDGNPIRKARFCRTWWAENVVPLIERSRTYREKGPWDESSFIRDAVYQMVAKMQRSRNSRKKRRRYLKI